MELKLTAEEVQVIVSILRFAVDHCPVESASDDIDVTAEQVEALVVKLEEASPA